MSEGQPSTSSKRLVIIALLLSIPLFFFSEHGVQVIWLGLIQGITEFLPVSSSAHLAMFPLLTKWDDQGLAFDCVVHLGTLTSVVFYFRYDLLRMCEGGIQCLKEKSLNANNDGKLLFLILLATIPVGLFGLAFKDYIETDLRSLTVIAWASIGFGVLLWVSDKWGSRWHTEKEWGIRHALAVGFAQALALIPGTSRSGATMTAALMLGYTREAAARFSFMLSIPVISLAGMLKVKDWIEQPDTYMTAPDLLLGFILSAVSAYYCIYVFLGFIERVGVMPFVVYRILLGIVLLVWFC